MLFRVLRGELGARMSGARVDVSFFRKGARLPTSKFLGTPADTKFVIQR